MTFECQLMVRRLFLRLLPISKQLSFENAIGGNYKQLSTRKFGTKLGEMPVKRALVFLAQGAEEMEFVISADVLRRGGVRFSYKTR